MTLDWQRTIVILAVLVTVVALALGDVLGSEAVVAVLAAITGWLVPAPKLAAKAGA